MKTRIIKRKGTLLSSVAMLSTAMLLTACGGDGGDSPVDDGGANPGESGAQALLYAYPDNGQGEVSTAAPVVLRFSSAVNLGEAQNSITVYEGDAQSGTMVAVTPESVAGEPNNVLLQPDEDLKPNQIYTVVIEDLRLRKGTAKDQTLTFTTRPLHEGPKSLVVKEDTFEVSRRMPDGSSMEPVMDFSSFRFQFTQPIDRATANYGDGNTVVLRDGAGDPVDATLLIDGAYMTVDPDAEYLNAGETYTLDITADLASTYGETFGAQSYTLTPKDSSPKGEPAILVQKLTQGSTSRLTGKPVNEVPVNGTLLGENKNITQASAEVVRAELADVTTYTDVTPIRLPKGTVLNGAEISPILIGGEVPAGFGSGDVTMTVLSDASGYLVPNPYAENNPDALRIVHLLMDVGIATSEARANGAFTQDLLHIELVGLAEVDPTAGVLNLDAVSVVEPNILGQEYGYGMLSFQLQSYKNQTSAPQAVPDTKGPTVQSWMPGDNELLQEVGDPIVINFDEALDETSLRNNVKLFRNGEAQVIDYYLDGSALVIKPEIPLNNTSVGNPIVYEVNVASGVRDIAGNSIPSEVVKTFELASVTTEKTVIQPAPESAFFEGVNNLIDHAPVVLAAYPGFPCALSEDGRDLEAGLAGRCAGGLASSDQGGDIIADDLVPVLSVPPRRPIIVEFSEEMDTGSIELNQTFFVERVDAQGGVLESVEGTLEVEPLSIKFTPNSPWESDVYYRYRIASSGYKIVTDVVPQNIPKLEQDADYECGVSAVCDLAGLPLQTQPLGVTEVRDATATGNVKEKVILTTGPDFQAGGPTFEQFFKGGEDNNNVVQVLRTLPVSDTNHNFFNDRTNPNAGVAPQTFGVFEHDFDEYGPTSVADSSYPEYDPQGVEPSKNSAKILSRYNSRDDIEGAVRGANLGCGYAPGVNTPLECSEYKFTFLTGAIVAEVTDEYEAGKGIKVLMWPSQIFGTSVGLFGLTEFIPGFNVGIPGRTGPQMLRMRYNEGSGVGRSQPVVAWIDSNGEDLELSADLDLYVDVPYTTSYGVGSASNGHNLRSFPISMQLTGQVNFLDDGRMVVEQYNINLVNILLRVYGLNGAEAGFVDLFIPERGSYLNFISAPIK